MSYTETKVIEMDKGKRVGDPLIQGAYSVPYDNNNSVGDELDRINEHLSDIKEIIYPIGCIIESTTCSTLALVKQTYGGNNWIQHTGYMLRGATSSVTANQAQKDGGADSQSYTPSGSNAAVTLTAAQSGLVGHTHGYSGTTAESYIQVPWDGYGSAGTATLSGSIVYTDKASNSTYRLSQSNHVHTFSGTTAIHEAQDAEQSHNHTFTGTQATISTLPNYKNVYIWERVS